jgi:hypothetical protein
MKEDWALHNAVENNPTKKSKNLFISIKSISCKYTKKIHIQARQAQLFLLAAFFLIIFC